jgi:hypothetical protein
MISTCMKSFIAVISLLLLTACGRGAGDHQFRYPCQDPANWDKPMCQKPMCEVLRECPEHVLNGRSKDMIDTVNRPSSYDVKPTVTPRGECR